MSSGELLLPGGGGGTPKRALPPPLLLLPGGEGSGRDDGVVLEGGAGAADLCTSKHTCTCIHYTWQSMAGKLKMFYKYMYFLQSARTGSTCKSNFGLKCGMAVGELIKLRQ